MYSLNKHLLTTYYFLALFYILGLWTLKLYNFWSWEIHNLIIHYKIGVRHEETVQWYSMWRGTGNCLQLLHVIVELYMKTDVICQPPFHSENKWLCMPSIKWSSQKISTLERRFTEGISNLSAKKCLVKVSWLLSYQRGWCLISKAQCLF